MYCNACEANPCSCTRTAAPVMPRQTYITQPHGITKEEFGLNLYDTIFTISGIRALEEHIAVAIHQNKGYQLQGFKDRRLALKSTLAKLLPKLTEEEMAQTLERYPFVVNL